MNSYDRFYTSYYCERIDLRICSGYLIFENMPSNRFFNEFMVFFSDPLGNNYSQIVLQRKKNFDCRYLLPLLPDGIYYLNIYICTSTQQRYDLSYLHGRNILIQCENGKYFFKKSPVLIQNERFIQSLKTDIADLLTYVKPTCSIQSYDSDLRRLATSITRFSHNDYHKLLAIHHWVAQNLYYDVDALYCDAYKYMNASATGVLNSKRCVCQGYTNLSVALLRALQVPSIGVRCFALGIETDGGWERHENMITDCNHIITLAYAQNRWVVMDVTWDSDNEYINGKFQKKTGIGVSHKYFDNTLEFISNTHRFVL